MNEWKLEEYNGWSNWSTWNMNLWLTNDYNTYRYIEDRKNEICDRCSEFDPELGIDIVDLEEATHELANFLLREFEGRPTPDMKTGDVLNVDWFEIAEAWLSE